MSASGLIGLRIRDGRKRQGITQAELARRVGISASYLNLIEADKRAIGGSLLQRIADALDVELDSLSGINERRLVAHLSEAAADPQFAPYEIAEGSADVLVSRHPAWAQAFLSVWRDLRDSKQQVSALSQRLDQDPNMAATVYNLLNQATTIRSTSEVLDTIDDLTDAERERFVDIILSRSAEMSIQAELLVDLFNTGSSASANGSPGEEVDDLFIQNNGWFPDIEDTATRLREEITGPGRSLDAALTDFLTAKLNYRIDTSLTDGGENRAGFRNSIHIDRETRRLQVVEDAPGPTRRFQMARLIALETQSGVLETYLSSDILSSDVARTQALGALASHMAGALLMPYAQFHEDAEQSRYDIDSLRQRHSVSIEQVCIRLLSLRKPGHEGIPFGFLRTDPAGHISKRFPIPGLPLPGSGNGCPLWPVYAAYQTPDRTIRQIAEFPNHGRFLLIARTVGHQAAAFQANPFLNSVMLACDIAYADRTVYADGLSLQDTNNITAVGPTCRLCPRNDCQYRGEASHLPGRNDHMTKD